jgi:epoxyqueuosine reductase
MDWPSAPACILRDGGQLKTGDAAMAEEPEHEEAAVRRRRLHAVATALGFDDLRVAAVTGPAARAGRFLSWLAEGAHGSMGWLAKDPGRRVDPREVLPGCRSVISVALNYLPPETTHPLRAGARGRFARYAYGDDYHGVMEARLRDLAAEVEALGGTHRYYVDTGPVLERDWASAAGLGWNGKSTVQIHRRLGTWFFLGEILTTLVIAPDEESRGHCGSCTRCMVACPTQAITAPHRMDARRCLSYLTIEHKGSIPEEFRRALGDRIYGCDDCLEVCPWNRFAVASREQAFAARPFVHGWLLREFLELSDAGFRELFRWSPVKRIGRPAFLRNVCVALGNVGEADDLPALRAAAADPDPLIAEHARWALAEVEARLPGR